MRTVRMVTEAASHPLSSAAINDAILNIATRPDDSQSIGAFTGQYAHACHGVLAKENA